METGRRPMTECTGSPVVISKINDEISVKRK